MNERIQELVMQSWNTYYNEEVNGSKFPVVQKFDAEKFAELIVKECADIGNKAYSDVGDYTYIGDKIKKHFGIE